VATYSQAEIDLLISCQKAVTEPPKRQSKLTGADFRNDMKLVASIQIPGEFDVFMRQSEDFPENFSIGLIYRPKDGRPDLTLLRCNGQHGVYNGSASQDPDHPHWGYHVHRASEQALENGLRPEKFAVATTDFASYEEAVQYFITIVNVTAHDVDKYFPRPGQRTLFD
jgi:hypothetical protein